MTSVTHFQPSPGSAPSSLSTAFPATSAVRTPDGPADLPEHSATSSGGSGALREQKDDEHNEPICLSDDEDHDLDLEGEYPTAEQDQVTQDDDVDVDDDDDETVPISVRISYGAQTLEVFNPAAITSRHATTAEDRPAGAGTVLFHDRPGLYQKHLNVFMEALQAELNISNDITLHFPQLELKFHTHMPFAESLSLLDLSFLASKASPEYDNVMLVTLEQERNSFVTQYNFLVDLADDGTEDGDDDEDEDESDLELEGEAEAVSGNGDDASLLMKRGRQATLDGEESDSKRQRSQSEDDEQHVL